MALIKMSSAALVLLVFATIRVDIEARDTGKQEESARKLAERCRQSAPFESLADIFTFYQNFKQVDECLHSIKEPASLCQEAEAACERANIDYQDVRPLGVLVGRYKSLEFVCTIEFASKIYRLHKRLEQTGEQENERPLGGALRILANRVAFGCRKSLAKRLLEVEQRTTAKGAPLSESLKHLNAILSCLNVGFERLERIQIEPEQVNPIYTDDLVVATRAISVGRDGFEAKLNKPMETYLDSIRASCSSLRLYQMNLLGSLGTLASVGYGISPQTVASLGESRLDKVRIHSWSLGAALCQSVQGVLMMSREKVDGKLFRKVKVLISQKQDVTLDEEDEPLFVDYNLAEEKGDRDLEQTNADRDAYKFDARPINRRKKQLLQGPNYRTVRAILAYIDPAQQVHRFRIPYEMLGLQPPTSDDQPEEEEDEEEEEEEG